MSLPSLPNNESYKQFNYGTHLSDQELDKVKLDVINYLQERNSNEVNSFITWLVSNHRNFLLEHQILIATQLLKHNHFEITSILFDMNIIKFDVDMASNFSFNLSLYWNKDFFDFYHKKFNEYDKPDKFEIVKNFWSEFLSYQFLKDVYVSSNLPNLGYVFDKIPFYEDSSDDLKNGSLINVRKDDFMIKFSRLNSENQQQLSILFGNLCSQHYPQFSEQFKEEFFHIPLALSTFNSRILHTCLSDTLSTPDSLSKKKNKI